MMFNMKWLTVGFLLLIVLIIWNTSDQNSEQGIESSPQLSAELIFGGIIIALVFVGAIRAIVYFSTINRNDQAALP